jgi:phage tail-like protein
MAVKRDDGTPYGAFNFRVTVDKFGGGNAGSFEAGFQEISGLGTEVAIAEYRNGNEQQNYVRKVNGLVKASDVTLKRGVIGTTDFFDWVKTVRDGETGTGRTVTIDLLAEDRSGPVLSWVLTNARPMKYTGATLNAKTGTDVAMEELVLACEKIDVK